ncbi:MAG: HTH domain-containing protein [Proteobacteria bacterium]|nr:HTH domain-containing protein [Pseudomonadota bacterium]
MTSAKSLTENPAKKTQPLERSIARVCDEVGRFIEYWGFKAIHGRIWALLVLHREPLSQSEIAQLLNVSRSLVSGAVSELVGFGLAKPVDDHRNAPYEAVMDVWPTVTDVLRSREWMLLERSRMALDGAIEEVESLQAGGESSRWNLDRMRTLLEMTELAQSLLKLLISIRAPRTAERFGGWLKGAAQLAMGLRGLGD